MERYYKNKYIKNTISKTDDLEFQIIEWHTQDESGIIDDDSSDGASNSLEKCVDKYTMRCFGVTADGISVTCKIHSFTPFYYIKVPDRFNKVQLNTFVDFLKNSYQLSKTKVNGEFVSFSDCLLKDKCSIIEKKDLYGFRNGRKYRFLRLVFNNYTAMNKSKYIFKNPVIVPGINSKAMKYKLYESNFEPFMRFCHIKDILMAGWIKLPRNKIEISQDSASSQIEVSIHWKDVVSLKDKKDIANFLQASWDIETYSYDRTFPDPCKKVGHEYPNVIYQIATTYKYYKESNTLVKHLLTLKKCESIVVKDGDVPIVVEECKMEKDLIKRWADLICEMDPDIMYTYNGDTFDCRYLYERSKLYGLDSYVLSKLSRLLNVPTVQKKETFSSSAYGDSDFVRFYIPGRLNYDLLIHYKRGMKKYPSYKLDFIANEILKEGKNDVSAKQIFQYYDDGTPEKIRIIGEYCIVDTELLQKLVDKQLVLITIIQLANVTFVPIGFLTTRGQTIKVFSQLLRKARQMDFLVPHTNFNEDSYPIIVKTKEEHSLDLEHIGEYVHINCGRNKNSYGKLVTINGKISEIIDETTFIVLSNTELQEPELFTSKCNFKGIEHKNVSLSNGDDLVDTSFTGATVLDATPGMYSENIAVLDFASLYPTIMISRNLCYSSFVRHTEYMPKSEEEGIFEEEVDGSKIRYERLKWDDKIEYTLKHTCEGIGKSGKNKGNMCGKQAYFEVSKRQELEHLKRDIENLEIECESLDDIKEQKKMKTKIRTKEKELSAFNQSVDLFDNTSLDKIVYYCRVHDPIKATRDDSEKFQKKDVSYNYVVVQQHTEEINGEKVKINQGVLPALLEELYAERKKVKREMAKAYDNGDKLLEDILNSTQLAIKVSLNSTYGFLGRGQGNLILKELGSIVTSVGRKLIQQSKEYAEGPFLDYIKDNSLLKQQLEYKKYDFSKGDRDIILQQFSIKNKVEIKEDVKIKEIEEIDEKPKKVRKKVLQIN
jgi:DNA polymerase elongation subunit (family B)